MSKIKVKLFNKQVEINIFSGNRDQIKAVNDYFSLYDKVDDETPSDIILNVGNENFHPVEKMRNPSIHTEIENGFIASYSKFKVALEIKQNIVANIFLENQGNKVMAFLRKLNNIQFSSLNERLPQIIYELILVPLVYLDKDKFLIHSSAFKKNDKTVLIGGTGGVGKTSLELELCLNRDFSFVADDISVVGSDGVIYPNLSLPKIYSYNLQNNEKLQKRVFQGRNLMDKAAWHFKKIVSGASGVRRTISPEVAFGKYEKDPIQITHYYILSKANVKEITIEEIDANKSAQLTIDVIKSEYYQFNNHLYWHEFNSGLNNEEPLIKFDSVVENWLLQAKTVFKKVKCFKVMIPFEIDHQEFVDSISDQIESNMHK